MHSPCLCHENLLTYVLILPELMWPRAGAGIFQLDEPLFLTDGWCFFHDKCTLVELTHKGLLTWGPPLIALLVFLPLLQSSLSLVFHTPSGQPAHLPLPSFST